MRRLVQALRCPQSLRAGTFVQCEGNKAVSCGRFVGSKAAKTTLLGYISSSMSAEPPPKSRDKWNKVCSQQPGEPVSSLHPICPHPGGETIDSGLASNHRQCGAPQHNIIPSGLCNWMPGPQPQHQFSLSHTIRIILSCSVRAFYTVILCRCRVGGSYGFADGRDHPSLNPRAQDLARVYMCVIPPATVSGPQPFYLL